MVHNHNFPKGLMSEMEMKLLLLELHNTSVMRRERNKTGERSPSQCVATGVPGEKVSSQQLHRERQ